VPSISWSEVSLARPSPCSVGSELYVELFPKRIAPPPDLKYPFAVIVIPPAVYPWLEEPKFPLGLTKTDVE